MNSRSILPLMAALVLSAPIVPLDAAPVDDPDFRLIYHFALLNDAVRYTSTPVIEATWSSTYSTISVVDIRQTRNRYFLGIDTTHHRQDIAIRGTTNLRNAIYDLRFLKSESPLLGIRVHHGFELMADHLFQSMEPLLKSDYPIRVSGQSLGGAEALILAMILERKGYTVERVITFGQPKVTDQQGAEAFAKLPLTRIVDMNDIVPLLPPENLLYDENPYVHFGREIILLSGEHYCIAGAGLADRGIPTAVLDGLSIEEIRSLLHQHSIATYTASLGLKLQGAVAVPCSERERFLPPQDRTPPLPAGSVNSSR